MRLLRPLARMWTALLVVVALALVLGVVARLLAPLTPWAVAPALLAADPPDGAADVRPRTPITLRFSVPMNRASAGAALKLDPPTPGRIIWSPDATTLTFEPEAPLAPAVTYTVSLDGAALGQWWRPLATPATVSFRTAPQPAVVRALPEAEGAPSDAPLAVFFSQPMVPPEAVGVPAALPELSLTPATPFSARWANQRTLVVYPSEPLTPATRYTATLSADLTDLLGVELGAPYSWSFTTGWPAVIARAPRPEARWVSPRAPLTLRLAAPIDLGLLRQALRITPPITGELAAEIIGVTQVVTFTPEGGWAYGTTYSVALAEPPGSGLGPPPALPWQFSVEPAPRLVAFFPGQGQVLPPGEAIRLVFSTPMDETALLAGLRVEPPVAELPISVSETEVRLRPDLAPSTLYTLTLAADTRDRSGEPLGAEAVVRLRTAPARPALVAPDAVGAVLAVPADRPAEVTLATTNLTALDLSLYPLDQATLLRALALRPDEWPAFGPERYGQSLARAWRVVPTAPLDQPGRIAVPVGPAEGTPLNPGTYYLRITSPEGPRADLILLAGASRLTLRYGPGYALVWATDQAGAPLPGQPVALYAGEALLGRGQTGPDGVWWQPLARAAGDPPLLAVAEGGPPALARGDWLLGAPAAAPGASDAEAQPQPAVRALLFPTRPRYIPGERVEVRGLARRRSDDGTMTIPPADTVCRLQLRAEGGSALGSPSPCGVDAATGVLSGTLALPPQLAEGIYSLVAQVGDDNVVVPLDITPPEAPRFTLAATPQGDDALLLRVSRGGLPLSGAVVSWTLRLEPLAAPAPPDGFAQAPAEGTAQTLSGQAAADADGLVRLALPPVTAADTYSLRASLPGDDSGVALAVGVRSPGPPLVAVGLPGRLVASDQRSMVRLLARDGLGRPLPNASVRVEVFRAGSRSAPVLARQAVAGADGTAAVELVQLRPGEYEVVASAGGPSTAAPLWVYGARFSGWSASPGELRLVADRDRYSPGDEALLLVAAPATAGTFLLTVERGALLSSEVRALSPGQVVRLPITAAMAPGVNVGVVLLAGGERRAGSTSLEVAGEPPALAAQLAAPMAEAEPEASVPVTITTTLGGAPAAANLLVTIAPADSPGEERALAWLAPGLPRASAVAGLPPTAANPQRPIAQRPGPPGYAPAFAPGAGAPGVAAGEVRLPAAEGRWRVTAYAASGPDVAAASALVTTSLPLAYDLLAPAALRPGDQAAVSLLVRNGAPVTRELTVTLTAAGLGLDPPDPAAPLTLGPGAEGSLRWSVAAAPGATDAGLGLTLAAPGLRETVVRDLPILGATMPTFAGETLVGQGGLATSLDLGGRPSGAVSIAVAPGLRAALADQAQALAALKAPSVEDQAALALIAAGLARGVPGAEGERWARAATAALDALDAAQNEDGGWGWWPGAPSRPFPTAFALEAQTAARAALPASRPPSLRAIAYLGRAAPEADAPTRAYVAYALARAGRTDQGAAGLASADLAPDTLAYLAMALPASQAAPLLDQLQAAAERAPAAPGAFAPLTWSAGEPAALPRGQVAVTAAATQALGSRRPAAAELPGAETALLKAWGVTGWPTAFDAARVAAALLDGAPAAGNGPSRVTLDGAPILGDGAPFTAVRRSTLPAGALPERPALAVQTRGPAVYLVAYAAPAGASQAAPGLSLLSEFVDPTGAAPVDAATLRAGQLVGLRLTAVVDRPVVRADLELPLPAGLAFVAASPRDPFQSVADVGSGLVRVGGAELEPGVYTQLVIARAVAPGTFGAPPPRLALPNEPGQTAVAPSGLQVTIGE